MSKLRVCVIGAGAAGLCACRHLASDVARFSPVVIEQSNVVGGTWVYTDSIGKDCYGNPIHSSMYGQLRTNLPKEIMAYPDFPFRELGKSFLDHTEVRQYLNEYCDHFGLMEFIEFNTKVVEVRPVESRDNKTTWSVTSQNVVKGGSQTRFFDSIMVCNGHYSKPRYPELPGIDKFEGLKIHSHDYRTVEPFTNLRVMVLGAAASGCDIGLEISTVAEKVYLSHNGPLLVSKLPANVVQVSGAKSCTSSDTFQISDGSDIKVDAVVFCTGYDYSFPFLHQSCNVHVKSRQVSPLYKHFIHTEFPTMCFIGIPFLICPFPQFDLQVRLFLRSILGEVQLPTRDEMNEDTERERDHKKKLGIHERHFHRQGDQQWNYNRELAEIAQIKPLEDCLEKLYVDVFIRRKLNLLSYKNDNFTFDGTKYVLKESYQN